MPQEKIQKRDLKAVPTRVLPSDDSPGLTDLCPKCGGTGLEIVPDKGARICSCRKLKAQSGQFERVGLPRRYDNYHFNNYKPRNESQTNALMASIDLVKNFPVDRGLLLMGNVGVGKTHLAVSILKGLTLERGVACRFYDFATLLKEIQDSYNSNTHTSELGVLAPVLNVPVLVLDELGASKPTEWVRDTMAHVINTRYNDRRLTIFTTNYLDQRPTDRDEVLEDRIGTRLRSRLYEMCNTVVMLGEDYRKNFDRAAARQKNS